MKADKSSEMQAGRQLVHDAKSLFYPQNEGYKTRQDRVPALHQ
jgi:hypothetical protein